MTELFSPVIVDGDQDSLRAAKATLRGLFTTLLRMQTCADAIAPFKSDGSKLGHKVLDDAAAVDALIEAAPAELAKQIEFVDLTQWERVQVLNQVLRRYFELDKTGKLTGAPSQRILALQPSESVV